MGHDRGFQPKVKKTLTEDGWVLARWNHCHEILQRPEKPGSIPVPYRINSRELGLRIFKQAGLKMRL